MLLIYIPEITERCRYTFQTILEEFLGISFELTINKDYFNDQNCAKLNYSNSRLKNEFYIASHSLLFEKEIYSFIPEVSLIGEMEAIFPTNDADIPFDPFAAAFYMLSRYEEYLPFVADKHGRFPAKKSIAYRHHFLKKPIVNYWLAYLQERLKEKFPALDFKEPVFHPILTYDIDIAMAYKGRSFIRHLAASAKDMLEGNVKKLLKRFQVINGFDKDPYDTYDIINNIKEKYGLPVICFFLLGDYHYYDKNLFYNKKVLKDIIQKVKAFASLGIHPSYASNNNPGKMLIEQNRLEKLSGKQIVKSRQHYLKLRFPDTYEHLIAAGIKQDYTLTYADQPGFRAGCCYPFRFYNLAKEKITELLIYPPAYMDGTLKDAMQLSAEESISAISALIKEAKKFNGTFISIWHNSSISESFGWEGWKKVHDQMLEELII